MNITHAISESYEGEALQAIFNRQRELMDKYHDIELRSGLLQTEDCPVNLDDKRGQARIKDFSWRITEEIGEALDALNNEGGESGLLHFHEELIDGLHFLTEMTILSGIDASNWTLNDFIQIADKRALNELIALFIQTLGMMCNCLKNKPWKQTMMKTNKENFYLHLTRVWAIYVSILVSQGFTEEDICDVYFKKSQVNKFRQRSNY